MSVTVPTGFDPTDPDIYVDRVPHEEFLAMRATAPVHWVEQTEEARAGFDRWSAFLRATRDLPERVEQLQVVKADDDASAILTLAVSSREYDTAALTRIVQRQINRNNQ